MGDRSLIIIGAGLAGLATGCYAQMNGYDSQIFEHHNQPGGVAAAWRRGDYVIDGGIHFVMGHRPGTGLYDLYRLLGVVPDTRFLDMTTYGRFVDEASSRSLVIHPDLDRLAADLRAFSPADAGVTDELVAAARAFQGVDMSEMGLSKPPELMGAWGQLKEMWGMRGLLRYVVGRYGKPVAEYAGAIQDPVLRTCIENLFLPEVPVYFVLMVLAMVADGQMGYIDGTCLDFVRAIEKRYKELGGRVTYRATVEEIVVEDDRAVGVRLADGTQPSGSTLRRAGAVVSAADGHSTLFKMLGGRYVNDKITDRYETWPTFRPLLMVNYGVAREFPGEPPFTTVRLACPLQVAGQAVEGLFLRIFNYSPRFAPAGKTVVQAMVETEWDFWNDLHEKDRAGYDAEKERVAGEILNRLEAHYPGIASQVEVSDVVTPYTFWRYTRNWKGSWEGWLMTPETVRTAIKRTLPGLERFYMAGQWV
ncbi:phytoene desaturase family protein, partial [Chloroflexota bacterium]